LNSNFENTQPMADDSSLLELYKRHEGNESKYTYFLLAAAGAAIGFAVEKTGGLRLSWWLAPVGIATVCWGLSFYCGCKSVSWGQAALHANYSFLQLVKGVYPDQPPPALTKAAASTASTAIDKNGAKAKSFARWQFRFLILGAVFFIAWRLLEMVRLTYAL
jgi:hypothetical protein